MFQNFFDQLIYADQLGYSTAWVAESHFSSEIQKLNRMPVIPNFKGEVGLNTDILSLVYIAAPKTSKIQFGSAIKNILCNGGPLAHAEAIKTFQHMRHFLEFDRKLHIGYASGRFPYINNAYGIKPRNSIEQKYWRQLKGLVFKQASEIFLRALKGEVFSSEELHSKIEIGENHFKEPEHWQQFHNDLKITSEKEKNTLINQKTDRIKFKSFWDFEKIKIIPSTSDLTHLDFLIGSQDPETQIKANQFLPVKIFNLSITPHHIIEKTHQRMKKYYHPQGHEWKRSYMPRTSLIFINDDFGLSAKEKSLRAKKEATRALKGYWRAMQGTINEDRLNKAINNSIYGNPTEVIEKITTQFHKDDRLMLWFDFFNHDNERVKTSMRVFIDKVAPYL